VCVSVLGGIQPGPLSTYVGATQAGGGGDDGLLQRFQLVVWPDDPGEWCHVDRWPDSAARARYVALCERLTTATSGTFGGEGGEGVAVPFLRFDPAAQERFNAWRADLERRLRGNSLPAVMEAHLAKYRSLVPSLALLIHLADDGRGAVPLSAQERAIGWGEYLEKHAWRLYGAKAAPEMEAAHTLARHIQDGELGERFTLRDVYERNWGGLDSKEKAEAALALLADRNWLQRATPPSTGGRPPSPVYTLNPRLLKKSPAPGTTSQKSQKSGGTGVRGASETSATCFRGGNGKNEEAPPPPEDTDYTPSDRPEVEAEAAQPWKGAL
jgi:putative DNA primase/helicase